MPDNNDDIIELSVEETNKLRATLGLAPLRTASSNDRDDDEVMLELSVDDSNAMREKLGLKPLNNVESTSTKIVHKPAQNEKAEEESRQRIEQASVRRHVQRGIAEQFTNNSLATDDDTTISAKSWAAQMRQTKTTETKKKEATTSAEYKEEDLRGMNVAHAIAELQEGSTTEFILQDAPILETRNDSSQKVIGLNEQDVQLENVTLAEAHKVSQGLRQKRQVELGMGRAGGYAGYDDDEFEELGGTLGPSRMARGAAGEESSSKTTKRQGFQIGSYLDEQEREASDLFASYSGKAISLEKSTEDTAASDFMTVEEEEAAKRARKSKKKEAKFKKKSKKKRKHEKRKKSEESEDEDDQESRSQAPKPGTVNLLDELEETATTKVVSRKRRRSDDFEENGPSLEDRGDNGSQESEEKKDKQAAFHAIMEKGNERSKKIFNAPSRQDGFDEEPDDSFLQAALAKARRLNRLKKIAADKPRGANAVVEAVKVAKEEEGISVHPTGTVEFSVDETREFTRAIRARTEQTKREHARKPTDEGAQPKATMVKKEEDPMDVEEETDLYKLAKEVKEEPESTNHIELGAETGSTIPVGRGLGNILSFLKESGELTRKNAGKEEMHGRARDKKKYGEEDSAPLSDVVKIDMSSASVKDKELASRAIKLEYRDKHGRRLTPKEAFRDMSYQFHGHGSGKRKEEKRLQQIEREQAAARYASRQASEGAGAGTFGALKATQKATGKAFVVHKTQS